MLGPFEGQVHRSLRSLTFIGPVPREPHLELLEGTVSIGSGNAYVSLPLLPHTSLVLGVCGV